MLTLAQLKKAMPNAGKRADAMFAPLAASLERAYINTPLRIAMYLSQIGHESCDLRYMQEIASGTAYEGRKDLGNIRPGDGKRFKGRGPIQITGRSNYTRFAKWSGLDCVNHPELLEIPEHGFLAAAWFWQQCGANTFADLGDLDGVSDVINRGRKTAKHGDANGYADRQARFNMAVGALS